MMKITTRCGQAAVDGLNEALLAKAVEAKVLKTNRLRADTTVVEANVAYPSDSSLLAKGVAKMATLGQASCRRWGWRPARRLADKTRRVQSRARSINANLRRRSDDKLAEVKRINGEFAAIAERVARQAERWSATLAASSRRSASGPRGGPGRRSTELERTAARTRKIAAQTRQRLAGDDDRTVDRVVSLHDPDARPIVKGRLGKPVEFGYKAQLVDNEDGVIVDHNIEVGNPPDAPMLVPAIERIKRRTGRAPRAVTADRGYGEHGVEDDLRHAGVRHVVLPTKGRPNAARRQIENRRAFLSVTVENCAVLPVEKCAV